MQAPHLGDALEGELLHQVHNVGLVQEAVLELLDRDGERRRVQHDLPVGLYVRDQLLDDRLELWRQ